MLDVAVLISEVDTHSKLQRHYSLPRVTLNFPPVNEILKSVH